MNPGARKLSSDTRLRMASDERALTSRQRIAAAHVRDTAADTRDLVARSRDEASEARAAKMTRGDVAAAAHEGARMVTGAEVVMRAAGQRRLAASDRARSADYRSLADEDHRAAARDRVAAAQDRLLALADREAFTRILAVMETDPLTGARTRLAGLADLDRELDRCQRGNGLLVVAYVDVTGLKSVNDGRGHAAGDELLRRVVALIAANVRSYDLVVRLGGDEFLCVMSNMSLREAGRRLEVIAAALAHEPEPAAIRWGLARLTPHDSAAQLIARADNELTRGSRDR